MAAAKPRQSLAKSRQLIAAKVRELRRSRSWSQADLAKQLQISQSRLSELEKGAGSFTAEQFLLLLKIFNVAASDFVSEPGEGALQLQNALARLGASHLQESAQVLPSERLDDVHTVVREALIDGSPRIVTALAPMLVRNADILQRSKLYLTLAVLGLGRRFAWVLENTIVALKLLRSEPGSKSSEWTKSTRMAELNLEFNLGFVTALDEARAQRAVAPDILDATIRSERTLQEVRQSSSPISQRWGIVTALQPEDFLQALKAARASH